MHRETITRPHTNYTLVEIYIPITRQSERDSILPWNTSVVGHAVNHYKISYLYVSFSSQKYRSYMETRACNLFANRLLVHAMSYFFTTSSLHEFKEGEKKKKWPNALSRKDRMYTPGTIVLRTERKNRHFSL